MPATQQGSVLKQKKVNNDGIESHGGFEAPIPRDYNQALFLKALKGNTKSLEELLENEKAILFDYAMRMTGDINHSWDVIQEQLSAIQTSHLIQCGHALVFRQALLLGIRKQLISVWHRDTSRLENAAYIKQINPDTENLNVIAMPPDSKAREFDREFHQLLGPEREALWLKAKTHASLEEIAQIMSLQVPEVERALVHALFRLENKSYGLDPESLVAQLPLHPVPAPVTNVTMDLSQVMQGIKRSQKAPQAHRGKAILVLLLVLGAYLGFEVFERSGKNWLVEDLLRLLGIYSSEKHKLLEGQKIPHVDGKAKQDIGTKSDVGAGRENSTTESSQER